MLVTCCVGDISLDAVPEQPSSGGLGWELARCASRWNQRTQGLRSQPIDMMRTSAMSTEFGGCSFCASSSEVQSPGVRAIALRRISKLPL